MEEGVLLNGHQLLTEILNSSVYVVVNLIVLWQEVNYNCLIIKKKSRFRGSRVGEDGPGGDE